jgi:hypothetical protein
LKRRSIKNNKNSGESGKIHKPLLGLETTEKRKPPRENS